MRTLIALLAFSLVITSQIIGVRHRQVISTGAPTLALHQDNAPTVTNLGSQDSNQRLEQGITTVAALSVPYVDLWLAKAASPVDLVLEIYADSGGTPHPSGSALGTSANVAHGSLITGTVGTSIRFTFASPISLSASTKYHLVLRKVTDGIDATNFYKVLVSTSSSYAGGGQAGWTLSTTTWANESGTNDWYFQVWTN